MPISSHLKAVRDKVGHDLLTLTAASVSVFDRSGRLLLGEDAETGLWTLPGGAIDPNEHPADAAVTPVYLTFVAMPELIAVHATSLDDPSQFNPQMVTYSIRGHAWDTIDSSLQKFERMPPG